MRTKRFLSILLSLVLVLGMLPGMSLTASAAGNTTTITPTNTSGTMTITLTIKAAQTITASDVTATYGDTDKSVSASVTTPTTGGGAISYAVKEGSGDYISIASDGKLTIKKVPPTDGKAYVIVTAAATDDYAETTKEVTVTISKAEATVAAKDQSIMVGGTVPDLSAPVLDTHYSVTGLVGEDTLTTAPTLAYQKNGSAATPDSATAGTYDIVPSGASAGDNYTVSYTNGTLTITAKDTQTITASDVTATYGDTDKNVSATTDGNGEISYTVKAGSENYIDVNTSTGALTIKAVPADGKAYVTVKATETTTGGTGDKGYAAATKDVTVNISKATVTIAAKDQSIYVGGTVPTLSGADFYTVTGLVGEETLTTNPTLAYQKNGSAVTPDNTTAGTYDIVPSGAVASDNYSISYTNGTLTISNKGTQTISAENVTATYGDTDKSVSATVTDPATGGGDISYAVKEGSGDYIEINASTGALTIKAVPADGKAYVIVTAAETSTYTQATKEVTVTINKANSVAATVTANNRTYDGTEKPLVTVTGEATGGEMQYALGTATEATQPYTTSIPSKTDAGTYYVWYKVVGDENHSDTTPASVTVTIQRRSSGGGSSTTTVTVPVTSDAAPGTVPVKASVSGTTATVTKLTDEQLAQVTTNKSGNKDADAETETNSVVIDVSGVAKDVKTATIPTETVKAVEETGSNLKVTLTDGSVEFDATAQAIITDEAKGTTIQVNLDAVKVTTLTSAQQSAVESLEVEVVLDAYVTSNGQRISDFKGGNATLSVPYTLKDGQAAQGIVVWYVASDGTRTQVDASYDGKNVVFTVPHFSNYVIAYDAAKAAACPQDTTCPISAFTDARTTAWYHDGVHWAIENSVMNGVGDGKFAPNGITTRAQVVTMLWRLEGSPAYVGMSEFSDVDNEQWYGPAIRWASAEGIVNGYDDGRFGANDAVTREQLVTILYRYAQYKKMDVSVGEDTNILSYDDAFDVSEWAIPAMQWACGSGIVNGIDKNGTLMLAPSDASTRAVVATMFWRFSK